MEAKAKMKAMCIFVNGGKVLASRGFDKVKNESFWRLIGGNIDFRERSEDAVRREIREELGTEINNLLFIKVVENIFDYEGDGHHEIAFIYKGDFANKDLYNQEKIRVTEPHSQFDAEWVSVEDILNGKAILYPAMDYSEVLAN